MEKPKKKYCKREGHDSGVEYCGNCVLHKERNETIDAMSTWLEGQVPSVDELNKIMQDHSNIDGSIDPVLFEDISFEIISLLTRKLTGKV